MLEELVNKNRELLNATDILIWKYVYNHKEECKLYSINELADKCAVSRTTILRFTKKLSFSGYSEFKSALNFEDKWDNEKQKISTEAIVESYHGIISDLQKKNWDGINSLLGDADYLFGYATGEMQRHILSELKREFNSAGKFIIEMGADSEANYLLDRLPPNSAVIIISFSGENQTAISIARKLKLLDIPTLSITNFSDNTLSSISTENIYVKAPKQILNPETKKLSSLSAGFFITVEMMLAKFLSAKK